MGDDGLYGEGDEAEAPAGGGGGARRDRGEADGRAGGGRRERDAQRPDAPLLRAATTAASSREDMNIIKTRAYRLEPALGSPGFCAVDGEVVPTVATQAEIFPKVTCFFG